MADAALCATQPSVWASGRVTSSWFLSSCHKNCIISLGISWTGTSWSQPYLSERASISWRSLRRTELSFRPEASHLSSGQKPQLLLSCGPFSWVKSNRSCRVNGRLARSAGSLLACAILHFPRPAVGPRAGTGCCCTIFFACLWGGVDGRALVYF